MLENAPASLLPRPVEYVAGHGAGPALTDRSGLDADAACAATAQWLRTEVGAATGLALAPVTDGEGPHITLRVRPDAGLGSEGYELTATGSGVSIVGTDPAGVFYGAQTLRQLLPAAAYRRAPIGGSTWAVPPVRIADRPRFSWRGCMLDVARHFMPKHDLLRFIDLLAMHKLNVLHLHLTDDQGWRVQIKRYPRLTEVGAWRHESQVGAGLPPTFDGRPHGGYYTQDDLRELVGYAAQRHITVVPEIDIPGHSQAAIAAYPELGESGQIAVGRTWGVIEDVLNVSDATLEFYRNVFDEVMEVFPSEYICIGGDECPKGQWRASSLAQQRIRAEGLTDEDELQSWFIRQFDSYFTARGRKLLGWDEILDGGLAPGAAVASWRGPAGGIAAARAGHTVVMCPTQTSYLDYRQSASSEEPIPVGPVLSLADVYAAEPIPTELSHEEARHVIGAQANVWTEHMDSPRTVDFMVFPRLSAFAETVWSPRERDFTEFLPRLRSHLERLDAAGVEYRPLTGPHPWQQRPGVPGRP
ncbi:beta-N-acetylhexosaminidase [Salinactinospora qingdaonensis]|uniref:beta-N-acetylhexosaminidase n=1 Tax=Salinactinospora qingdaonensis TaxID=702744 RepID=A0ABP7EW23_9ACTN